MYKKNQIMFMFTNVVNYTGKNVVSKDVSIICNVFMNNLAFFSVVSTSLVLSHVFLITILDVNKSVTRDFIYIKRIMFLSYFNLMVTFRLIIRNANLPL